MYNIYLELRKEIRKKGSQLDVVLPYITINLGTPSLLQI